MEILKYMEFFWNADILESEMGVHPAPGNSPRDHSITPPTSNNSWAAYLFSKFTQVVDADFELPSKKTQTHVYSPTN